MAPICAAISRRTEISAIRHPGGKRRHKDFVEFEEVKSG
jgi:hypothetical protein